MTDRFRRASGILLHPTSLPGPYGVGELGAGALAFLDFLAKAGQGLWQVLPLGPTGYGDSPYASFSTFAGNPLLVSVEELVAAGDLEAGDLEVLRQLPRAAVDYGRLSAVKLPLLRLAARRFLAGATPARREAYERFCEEERAWLEDFALFMAVKDRMPAAGGGTTAWNFRWDRDIAERVPAALERWRRDAADAVAEWKVIQFHFFAQWRALREHARALGIRIIGDLPIFVAPDSADLWANPELFKLDGRRRPAVVSGVPPDYFSSTGQLWGNPLYDWEEMRRQGFAWWIERLRFALRMFDFVRIDHFRGFQACWEVPAGEPTAVHGRWVETPGSELFDEARRALGDMPVIAEDLGVITPEVEQMRERFGFPGMIILQFAFDAREAGGLDPANRFLPHNHRRDSVVYTGTHDNDTTVGWFADRTAEERRLIGRYLGCRLRDVARSFVRLAMSSVARHAVVPLQDTLGLGREARMNTPSTPGGNWRWRAGDGALAPGLAEELHELAALYGRAPDARR